MYRLTHAPLPGWGDIARSVSQGSVTDSLLAQPWMRSDERSFWFSRSAWSLFAIAQFRRRVTGQENIRVWFPDYFCNASIAPLRELGSDIDFYPLSIDGCPDLSVCETMLEGGKPDLIVLVHYFGAPTPTGELARFAHENGAWLIEDSAHILRPVGNIGQFGDFIIYSPHKFLPIPDGAILLARRNSLGKISNDLLEKYDFLGLCQSLEGQSRFPANTTYEWLAKRLLQKLGVRSNNLELAGFYDDVLTMNAEKFSQPGMSLLARKLLFRMNNSLDEEIKVREINGEEWCIRLAKLKGIGGSMVPLQSTHTPYLAGFSFNESGVAEKVYNRLRNSRIPVTTWPDLPPEVTKNPVRHRAAISMRETRIFLPVHRSINPSTIQFALKGM